MRMYLRYPNFEFAFFIYPFDYINQKNFPFFIFLFLFDFEKEKETGMKEIKMRFCSRGRSQFTFTMPGGWVVKNLEIL